MRVWFGVVAGLVFALGAFPVCAEDADADAKEAADEEAAQRKKENELDRPIFSYVFGVVQMKPKEQRGDGKGVIATLKGRTTEYQIKAQYPELIADLEKWDGKRARLTGNARNKGRYFVASSVSAPQPTDKDK